MTTPDDTRDSVTLTLPNADLTTALGGRIAPLLASGDTLLLSGPIGAGKSHLARSVIRSLLAVSGKSDEDVPSPTYTLVQTYDCGSVEVWHADLYRLSGPDEIVELGLDVAFEQAICLVEWPDRLAELTPQGALDISLDLAPTSNGRVVRFSSENQRWQVVLAMLETEFGVAT